MNGANSPELDPYNIPMPKEVEQAVNRLANLESAGKIGSLVCLVVLILNGVLTLTLMFGMGTNSFLAYNAVTFLVFLAGYFCSQSLAEKYSTQLSIAMMQWEQKRDRKQHGLEDSNSTTARQSNIFRRGKTPRPD